MVLKFPEDYIEQKMFKVEYIKDLYSRFENVTVYIQKHDEDKDTYLGLLVSEVLSFSVK